MNNIRKKCSDDTAKALQNMHATVGAIFLFLMQ